LVKEDAIQGGNFRKIPSKNTAMGYLSFASKWVNTDNIEYLFSQVAPILSVEVSLLLEDGN